MSNTTTDITREIKYSRADRDYACYVNGQYIGSCANYSDGEALCNQVAYDLLMDGQCATAAELDGGSDVDTLVAVPFDGATTLPTYGANNCAGCGGPVPCRCDDEPLTTYAAACTSTNLCSNPNHNHSTIYTALLAEADRALSTCPGAFEPCGAAAHPSYAPFCQKCALALQRVAVAAYVQRLAADLGPACVYCGEAHGAADCPLRRPLIVPSPRACGNCGGAHSIQRCGELRAALFAVAA